MGGRDIVVSVGGGGPGSASPPAGTASGPVTDWMSDPAVITQVDGHMIGTLDDLGTYLHAHVPGDHVSVTWVDRQGTHTATATLTTGPVV